MLIQRARRPMSPRGRNSGGRNSGGRNSGTRIARRQSWECKNSERQSQRGEGQQRLRGSPRVRWSRRRQLQVAPTGARSVARVRGDMCVRGAVVGGGVAGGVVVRGVVVGGVVVGGGAVGVVVGVGSVDVGVLTGGVGGRQ
eukprot:512424-Pleurochrysis_carterae.AAC.1